MQRRWLYLFLGLIGCVTFFGLKNLKLEADILATLPPSLPEVQGLKLLRDAFIGGDELILGVESPDAAHSELVVRELVSELQKRQDLVKSVRWGDTFDQPENAGKLLAWSLINAKPESIRNLEARTRPEHLASTLEDRIEELATSPDPATVQRVGYDPLNLLSALDQEALKSVMGAGFETKSKDGKFLILFVSPPEKFTSYVVAHAWLTQVKALATQVLERHSSLNDSKLWITGEPAFLAETGQGIEKDMRNTIGLTELLITLLFWFMFRSLKPLLYIHLFLVLIMVLTLALSSLIMGSISVMSLGFAAIVLGIVVDYAVLMLQEANDHPELKPAALRRKSAPGIIAGAVSTSAVFLALWFSGLPGLAHLGTLVALGIVVGMGVMLWLVPYVVAGKTYTVKPPRTVPLFSHRSMRVATGLVIAVLVAVLSIKGLPEYNTGSEALRPLKSEAIDGWNHLQQRLGSMTEATVPLVVEGKSEELLERAAALQSFLKREHEAGNIVKYHVPEAFLYHEANQSQNIQALKAFVSRLDQYLLALDEVGFTEQAGFLLKHTSRELEQLLAKGLPLLASQTGAAEILGQFLGDPESKAAEILESGEHVMLGSITLAGSPGTPDQALLRGLHERISSLTGVHLTGWESLGMALSELVKRDVTRLTIPLSLILVVMLGLTYRNAKDVLLSVGMMLASIAALLATMSVAGFQWNLASLAAIPLLVGTGIDYGIHVLLSMARNRNQVAVVQSTTNRAVFFSGMTTVIGFSSLISAGNRGVMSLGLSCCLGTLWVMIFVLLFLPYWRAAWVTKK